MCPPFYRDVRLPNSVGNGHRGLWHDRFFNRYSPDWTLDDTAKKDWMATVAINKTGDRTALGQASLRMAQLCNTLQGRSRIYTGVWHFVTGLGNPHPVENGFLWHPTLGTPYIPGAAVKGLLRAWMECWHQFATPEDKSKKLLHWFGSENKEPEKCSLDSQSGALIFFDALPVSPVELKLDVMTPHMGKWYEKGNDINSLEQSDRIPADWHDPVPVHFLVAHKPSFLFLIAPRRPADHSEVTEALDALGHAIEWLGAGAKTAVGYGQMQQDNGKEEKLRTDLEARAKKERQDAEKRQQEIDRRNRLAKMSPLERKIAERFATRSDKNQSDTSFIYTTLRGNQWPGDEQEKKEVTEWLQRRMQGNKEWRPKSQAKKPEKDRDHQKTLQVMAWLREWDA